MAQLQVLVVGNDIVPRDTPCVVAARSVAELGHQLRTRCVPERLFPRTSCACLLRGVRGAPLLPLPLQLPFEPVASYVLALTL
jgi:hypothetical protein